ncbi:DivIVA domain-containing protein [Streptomyces sp. N35]|uniref:DivIVA domain-containing protein n=1 Tax=Streptomyces sp. N35 TaxID=2795730 RepID=UPI0018F3841D|nr:DivIVA domain-containing protein [Streptomyces sp. N35]
MALTPQDISNKQFTTVRLREGYAEEEVDSFLDEVESEFARLLAENADLRTRLAAAGQNAVRAQQPLPASTPTGQQPGMRIPLGGAAPTTTPVADQTMQLPVVAPTRSPRPTGHDADSAARVLALAQKMADQVIGDARSEAQRITADAREAGARIERTSQANADVTTREAQDKYRTVMGSLESARATLEHKIDGLRDFEQAYRTRLGAFLEGQLAELNTQPQMSLALVPAAGEQGLTPAVPLHGHTQSA